MLNDMTILLFRNMLEQPKPAPRIPKTANDLLQHKELQLKTGAVENAAQIAPPSSANNATAGRDPMQRT